MVRGFKPAALLVLGIGLATGCSTVSSSPTSSTNPDQVREHAERAFQQLKAHENHAQQTDLTSSPPPANPGTSKDTPAPLSQRGLQVPLAEIGPSDGDEIHATGYGALSKGLYLCQHSADLAARVELAKLIRVQVKETAVDRIRERTGKEAEQDIDVVRESLVNEILSGVRIVARTVDQKTGYCSSTAVIPRRTLGPTPTEQAGTPQ